MQNFSEFKDKTAWIIVEPGLRGTENQCIALAEGLGIEKVKMKYIEMKKPWVWGAPYLKFGRRKAYKNSKQLFSQPYPDIIIASGRKSVPAARKVKELSNGKSFLIQIQDPRISPIHFDLVIAPQHDPVDGPNVIKSLGALHRISAEFLKNNLSAHSDKLSKMPSPRLAVLIGGTTTKSNFTDEDARILGENIANLQKKTGASLMITTSRRTGQSQTAILKEMLDHGYSHFWDGQGSNPYFDYLYMADDIIVTNDSVSMATEALATGKPVYIAHIGAQGPRIETFHSNLAEKNLTKPIPKDLEDWQRPQSNDMIDICQSVATHYKRFLKG